MIRVQTVVLVWRCPDCPGVYDGEGLPFLYTDEDYGYCPCGGRLVEDVASERSCAAGRSYRSASRALRRTGNWRGFWRARRASRSPSGVRKFTASTSSVTFSLSVAQSFGPSTTLAVAPRTFACSTLSALRASRRGPQIGRASCRERV